MLGIGFVGSAVLVVGVVFSWVSDVFLYNCGRPVIYVVGKEEVVLYQAG